MGSLLESLTRSISQNLEIHHHNENVNRQTDKSIATLETKMLNIKKIITFIFFTSFTHQYQLQGSRQSGEMCLTHSPVMEGVCRPARTCQSYQGFCQNSGNVCCVDVYKCGGVTKERVSYFQNEEFPAPAQTGTLCSHILKVSKEVCFVKID